MLFLNPIPSNNLKSNLNFLKKVENSAWRIHLISSTGVWFSRFFSWHVQDLCLCLFATTTLHTHGEVGQGCVECRNTWLCCNLERVVNAWVLAGQSEFKNKIVYHRHRSFFLLVLTTLFSNGIFIFFGSIVLKDFYELVLISTSLPISGIILFKRQFWATPFHSRKLWRATLTQQRRQVLMAPPACLASSLSIGTGIDIYLHSALSPGCMLYL